jgi:hypothetical protein
MADEPDDTEPDLLRDRLFMQAEHGEITGEQAEEAAAAHGLEPFETKPELPRFDPKLKSHWSIVMAVAWIARRDFEMVREQDAKFCSEYFHWIGRERKVRPQNDGEPVKRLVYSLEARLAPTVSRLALLDAVSRVRGNVPSTAVMMIQEAVAELWRALSEGDLIAKGFNTKGVVVEIPSREWAYLRLREAGGRDVLSYDSIGGPEPFTAVTFLQRDLLRLWPVTGEFPVLPATTIDKGGRPTKAAIKGIRTDEPSNTFGIATTARRGRWQVDRVKLALRMEFPDGVPPNLTEKEVQGRIKPIFVKMSWRLPSVDSIARARGRRTVG